MLGSGATIGPAIGVGIGRPKRRRLSGWALARQPRDQQGRIHIFNYIFTIAHWCVRLLSSSLRGCERTCWHGRARSTLTFSREFERSGHGGGGGDFLLAPYLIACLERLTMSSTKKQTRWPYLLMLVAAITSWYATTACQHRHPAKPFAVGLVTWIGYAPIYIARDKHFFEEEGIQVDVKTLDGPGARESAYQAGELDFFPNTPDAFCIFFAERPIKGKLVAGLDESEGADGIIATDEIKNVRDLKGKRVGFQSGITSHFLLLYLLKQYGLSGRDIIQIDLSASDAGQAFIAGKLDAAVTWEPWLSTARQTPHAHILATSYDTPGVIVDVMLVSERALSGDKHAVKAFMKAWYRGVNYLKTNPVDAETIVGKAINAKAIAEVRQMLKTTEFYSSAKSDQYLHAHLPTILTDANTLFFENGVIRTKTDLSPMIDNSMLSHVP
jgi:NitT/TauT family transport system substrate-binding protein